MAGRRGNNEGSISQRPDGRWEARISLDSDKRKSFYGKTRQEVARKLTQALRDRDKGLPIIGEKQTVAQYLATWLTTIPSTVEVTTVRRYEREVRLRVNPQVGNILLARLTGQHLQSLYSAAFADNLSTTSVRLLHTMLHRAFKDAVRLGLMQRNVTEMVDSPRKRDHEMQVLNLEQSRVFLEAVKGNRYEALFVLALSTGMRQGELLALRWQDVDIDDGHVQVRTTLKVVDGKPVIEKTKTRRSRRKIALTPQACEAVRRHRVAQHKERLALGPAWDDCDLLFPNTIGRPFDCRGLVRRNFLPILRKANLPRIRFHDLRHTAATLMLLQGVHPKVVSEMLGHASIAITLDLYSHVLPDMQREAVKAMSRILEGYHNVQEGERGSDLSPS